MNTENPLVPQGSNLEQKNKGRARVKIAVFFVLAIHGIGLLALLMQGCKKEDTTMQLPEPPTNAVPEFVEPTNAVTPPPTDMGGSNAVVTPAPEVVTPPAPVPPPAPISSDYKVAKGDNFTTIAKHFRISVKALTEANPGVDSSKLKIGQPLHIPIGTTAPATEMGAPLAAPETAGGEQVYSVKSGDTLTKIAAQFHTNVKALRSLNNLTTDKIKVGQKLKIPAAAPAPTPAPGPAPAPAAPIPATQ